MEIGQVLEEGWKGKLTLPLTVSNKDISSHTDCQMKQLAKESFPRGVKYVIRSIKSICSVVC